jgi:hypothetical protein
MSFDRSSYNGSNVGPEIAKVLNGFRREHDSEWHSGQNIARISYGQDFKIAR